MTIRRIARPTSLGLMLLAGCAGNPGTAELLTGARDSLQADDVPGARQFLQSAEPGLETDRERKDFELLTAEADVRSGSAEVAWPAVERLLEAYPDDPRVHEVAGKVAIARGAFGGGSVHFNIAAGRYTDAADVARARDLVALAKGLDAYAAGRLAEAREQWSAIKERALRASVLDAAGEPDDSGALAQSGQPNP